MSTESSSSVRESSLQGHDQPQRAGPSSQSQQFPPTFCKADEYLVRALPGYKPMTQEQHQQLMRNFGATDATMQQFMDNFDKAAEYYTAPGGVGVVAVGMKPKPGDRNVYTVSIPETDLVIRIFDGGMSYHDQYCLDFYDTRRGTAVNLPEGYSLWPAGANMPGVFMMGGPLPSWEVALGYQPAAIPPGEEKWSVPAGSYVTLKRSARPQDDITFAIPRTQYHSQQLGLVVQPTLGYPQHM